MSKKLKDSFTFSQFSIRKTLELYKTRELSPVDVAEFCVQQVERLESEYKAWVYFDKEKLLDDAKLSEKSLAENEFKELVGIPFGVKDIFNTIDFPTEMGSPIWKNFKPGNDSRVVYYLKQAGALIPGKTVTAEFAVHTPGPTLNPHDKFRTPGTSSSGSAVTIALGMLPAALGTQTAGSIMRPASYCGVWGFKPSFGLIPRTGMLKTTDSLDSIGFFVYHFTDLKRVFDVIRVKGRNYPISDSILNTKERQNKRRGQPFKVAFVKTHLWKYAQGYSKEAISKWILNINKLKDIEVEEVELPKITKGSHEIHSTIYDKTLSYYFAEEYKRTSLVSKIMRSLIAHGNVISLKNYLESLKIQEEMVEKMDSFFEKFDIIVSLSTAGIGPLLSESEPPDPCLLWTMTHLPVIGAPVFNYKGLPFGIQIVARKYNDYLLLNFAKYLMKNKFVPATTNPILKL